MGFIDLFRPKWRHSDIDVRAEAVRSLGADQFTALVQVAQKDKDARVRRIAVKRLDDPRLLADIAVHDPDEGIRELAGEKAAGFLVQAALADSAGAERALAELRSDRDLVEVARRAAREPIRKQAVARITDGRSLLEVVRRAEIHDVRAAALARITDVTLLAEIASTEESKALALAALERVTDAAALVHIAQVAKAKVARSAARDRLPKDPSPDAPAAKTAAAAVPRAAEKTRRAKLMQLALAAEAAAQRNDWDAATHELDELRGRFAEVEAGSDATLEKRFEDALKKFAARREADAQARARAAAEAAAKKAKAEAARRSAERAAVAPPAAEKPVEKPIEKPVEKPVEAPPPPLADRLSALVLEAEKMAAGKTGEARLLDLERRYHAADDAAVTEADVVALRERFEQARAQMAQRIGEEKAKRDAEQAESRARLEKAAEELERRAEKTDIRGAEAAIKQVQGLLRAPGDETLKGRIRAAVDKVTVKLAELREAESWKRFANVPKLEELCKEAEALATVLNEVEDKRRAPALLKDLQARWKAAGAAPKDKHEALWTRFKAACDAVFEKSKEYFGKLDEERGANLVKKEELCVKVEALKDSTDWKETSEAIKRLREDWKAIGPVPQEKGDEIWRRFRAACDAFFDRRAQNDKSRDEERLANLSRKEAICARVEALQTSREWKQTADTIKAAQEEWQTIGPAPRDKGDEVWKRFRAACDAFFAARKAAFEMADSERQENLARKLLLCEKVEALSAADDHDAALATVKELQAEWKSMGPVPKDQSDEIWRRFRSACDVIFAGPQGASVAEIQQASATGVAGFANRLPLEGIVAKLQLPDAAAQGDAGKKRPT